MNIFWIIVVNALSASEMLSTDKHKGLRHISNPRTKRKVKDDYKELAESALELNFDARQKYEVLKQALENGLSETDKYRKSERIIHLAAETCFDLLQDCYGNLGTLNNTIHSYKAKIRACSCDERKQQLDKCQSDHNNCLAFKNNLQRELEDCCENNRKLEEKKNFYIHQMKFIEDKLNSINEKNVTDVKSCVYEKDQLKQSLMMYRNEMEKQKLNHISTVTQCHKKLSMCEDSVKLIEDQLNANEKLLFDKEESLAKSLDELSKMKLDYDMVRYKAETAEYKLNDALRKFKVFEELEPKLRLLQHDSMKLQKIRKQCWEKVEKFSKNVYMVDNKYIFLYTPYLKKTSWLGATQICHSLGMSLASPETEHDKNVTYKFIQHLHNNESLPAPSTIWSGFSKLAAEYTSYGSGTPCNCTVKGDGQCVLFAHKDDKTIELQAVSCNRKEAYICEMLSPCRELLQDSETLSTKLYSSQNIKTVENLIKNISNQKKREAEFQ